MRACLIVALVVFSASPARSAEKLKLAVLEFEVQKDLAIDRRTFSSQVQNAARTAAPQLFVMTQANIVTMLRGQGKKLEECEGECAVETGRLIGADIVIAGRISKVGRTLVISMQMYETARGELLAGEDVRAKSEDELLEKAAEAATRLLKSLGGRTGGVVGKPPAATSETAAADASAAKAPGTPSEPRTAARGVSSVEPKSGLRFVAIPGGTFQYQGEREGTVKAFRIGATAVTVLAYARCVKEGACSEPRSGGAQACNWGTERTDHPINCVDWHQATAFCRWIGGRLLSEEEREYVAAGGSEDRTYPWGNEEPGSRACWNGTGNDQGRGNRKTTCAVRSYKQGDSKWGVHDLAGNVFELTSSPYDATYMVIRGGGWWVANPLFLRAWGRARVHPNSMDAQYGFRCGL